MASKPIVVGTSPITGTIYAGTLLKDRQTWSTNRSDVTGMACGAVAEHVTQHGGSIVVTSNGEPAFEITVKDLRTQPAKPEAPNDG